MLVAAALVAGAIAVSLLLLIHREGLEGYTTHRLPATGKRARFLIPAGWKSRPLPSVKGMDRVFIEPAPRLAWLRVPAIRRWLRLDVVERDARMVVLLRRKTPGDETSDGPGRGELLGDYGGGGTVVRGPYSLTVLYTRKDSTAVDRDIHPIFESLQIVD